MTFVFCDIKNDSAKQRRMNKTPKRNFSHILTMMVFLSEVLLSCVIKPVRSTDNIYSSIYDETRTKKHDMDIDTKAITNQCYLCHNQTVMNSIISKNITHLYKGSIASNAYLIKKLKNTL